MIEVLIQVDPLRFVRVMREVERLSETLRKLESGVGNEVNAELMRDLHTASHLRTLSLQSLSLEIHNLEEAVKEGHYQLNADPDQHKNFLQP